MSKTASTNRVDVLHHIMEPRRGFWGGWLNFTAPPRNAQTTASPRLRESLRKAELTGYFLFVIGLFSFFDIALAVAYLHITSVGEVLAVDLLLILIAFLNRKGFTRLAPAILIACVMTSIIFVIAFTQSNKSGADLFPTYDFFIYPIIIGSLFLDRRLIFPFTLVAIAFVVFNLLYQAHGSDIVHARGTSTIIIWLVRPIATLFVVALVGLIGARSVEASLLRADHAEELVEAERQVVAQSSMIAAQKAQLEYEIAQILLIHKEAAAGNYAVRAPVRTDEAIWQIGRSLNNLLARYEHFAQDRQELARTQADIEGIAQVIDANRHGRRVPLPVCQSIGGKRMVMALSAPTSVDARIQMGNPPHTPNIVPDDARPSSPATPYRVPTRTSGPLPNVTPRPDIRKTRFARKDQGI